MMSLSDAGRHGGEGGVLQSEEPGEGQKEGMPSPFPPPTKHANVRRVCWAGAVVVGRAEDGCVCGLVAILVFHH